MHGWLHETPGKSDKTLQVATIFNITRHVLIPCRQSDPQCVFILLVNCILQTKSRCMIQFCLCILDACQSLKRIKHTLCNIELHLSSFKHLVVIAAIVVLLHNYTYEIVTALLFKSNEVSTPKSFHKTHFNLRQRICWFLSGL